MPQYFFTIRAGDEGAPAERAAVLDDDAAALAYACEIVRELMQSLARVLITSARLRSPIPFCRHRSRRPQHLLLTDAARSMR